MRLKTVKYIIKEGIANTWRNKLMCIASMAIVAAALIIFGIFVLIGENISFMGRQIESSQKIQAFLDDGMEQEKIDELRSRIEGLGLTSSIDFETKEQALENLKKREMFKGHERLLEGYDSKNNPLRPSFILTLKKAEDGDRLVKQLEGMPEIKKVNYFKEVLDQVVRIMNITRVVSLVVLVLLSITSVFIIANTIKLTVFARRKEIGIMKYIGATDWFIRWPFIIESMVIGAVGSVIALFTISKGYEAVLGYISRRDASTDLGISGLVGFSDVSTQLLLIYLVVGIGISCVGSVLSIRKYLRV